MLIEGSMAKRFREGYLKRELETFEANLDQLLKEHSDKYVAIQGETILSAFDDVESAHFAAIQKWGAASEFLINKITKEPDIVQAPAFVRRLDADAQ